MRVGTSDKHFKCFCNFQDHPHACGDKPLISLPSRLVKGSSPCVWGQVKTDPEQYLLQGIIPMRVGTSEHRKFR